MQSLHTSSPRGISGCAIPQGPPLSDFTPDVHAAARTRDLRITDKRAPERGDITWWSVRVSANCSCEDWTAARFRRN